MSKIYENIVVGGGMAGIACAYKLRAAGKDVLMITDTLGGRVCYDEKLNMNYGAVFYMENYHNVKGILEYDQLLMKSYSQVMCHKSRDDYFPALSFRMLKNLPQLIRFKRFMKKFMSHYEIYKRDCENMPVQEAMARTPFIRDLYFKTAQTLIKELKIDRAGEELVSQFVYGCTGTDVVGLNALDFCNCAQGLVIPIYKFTLDEKKVEKRIGTLVRSKVTKVEKNGELNVAVTEDGTRYEAKNLVLATPAVVTKELLGLKEIRKSSQLIAYLVKGTPRKKYAKHDIHCFADTIPLIFFYNRRNGKGEYEIFSVNEISMREYFETYEILGKKEWPDALYVKGDVIMEQVLGGGLYTAGDHNGLGMEPAAVSGVFAANMILSKKR